PAPSAVSPASDKFFEAALPVHSDDGADACPIPRSERRRQRLNYLLKPIQEPRAEGLRLAATADVSSNSTRKECHDAQGLSSYPELGNLIAVRNAGFIGSELETVYGSISTMMV